MHPEEDGVTRVASIKTVDDILTRPISKICLPIEESNSLHKNQEKINSSGPTDKDQQ